MFTNGLGRTAGIGTTGATFRRAMAAHADRIDARLAKGETDVPHPAQLGVGMVLEARGNVYGDVRTVGAVEKGRRRAAGKRAKAARKIARGNR